MKKSRTKNFILNLLTGFFGQILTTILKFTVRTIFISTLGKSYLGINGLFSDILMMLSLTELGIDTAINFRLYKPIAENDSKTIRKLLKFYKKAYRYVGIIILVLGICLIPSLKFLIKDYESLSVLGINVVLIFLLYLLQSVCSYLFYAYRRSIINADQKTYILEISNVLICLLTNIIQIFILLIFKNFIFYTITIVIFNILENIINGIIAKKLYPDFFIKEEDNLSREEIIDMLKDCGALFVYKINWVVLSATDNLVISLFIGLSMVGMYSNYLMIYNTIKNFINKFYNSSKASMGNLFAVATIEKKYFFFEVMNYLSIILYGTACIGIGICANDFIRCWIGEDYVLLQPIPILIGIEMLLTGIKNNLGQVRNISGVFRQMWYRPIMSMTVNFIVSIILVQFIGISGVLIGTILADFLCNFLVDPRVIHKYTFNNYRSAIYYYKNNIIYFIVLFLIGLIDLIICDNIFVNSGWFSFIVHAIICGISVPTVFIILYWKTDICKYLINKVKTIFIKV